MRRSLLVLLAFFVVACSSTSAPVLTGPRYIITDENPACPTSTIFAYQQGKLVILDQSNSSGSNGAHSAVVVPGLHLPRSGMMDKSGNFILADGIGGIFRVAPATGTSKLVASTPPYNPRDVAIDKDGSYIVADWPLGLNGDPTKNPPPAIWRISPSGKVSVIYSGSPLVGPHGVAVTSSGTIVVADARAGLITISGSTATVLVPTGPKSLIGALSDVRIDASGNYIVTDVAKGALFKITPDGQVSVIHAGAPFGSNPSVNQNNAPGVSGGPRGLGIALNGDYLVADDGAKAIFDVKADGTVSVLVSSSQFCSPAGIVQVS